MKSFKNYIFVLSLVVVVSCKSSKPTLTENLMDIWAVEQYIYPDTLHFTTIYLVFTSEDSLRLPLRRYMPLNSNRAAWKLHQSNPIQLEIFCRDSIFSGTWEMSNIQMFSVPQYSDYIKSFELKKDSCIITFGR